MIPVRRFARAHKRAIASLVTLATVATLGSVGQAASAATPPEWTATWGTAIQASAPINAGNFTCRNVIQVSAGGEQVRIHLSARLAAAAVEFGAVSVAKQTQGAAIDQESLRAVTFSGQPGVSAPAGSEVVSDPVELTTHAGEKLAVSIHLPGWAPAMSLHQSTSVSSNYCTISGMGDATGNNDGTPFAWIGGTTPWVSGVDVMTGSSSQEGSVVAFGDSLTDGYGSTVDGQATWPDRLAHRLAAAGRNVGVVNAGISGNTITMAGLGQPRGLDRFEADVIDRAGVKAVVLFIGTNDLTLGATSSQVIDGLSQLSAAAHDQGITVIGATLIPRRGGWGGYDDMKDVAREEVNAYIRTSPDFDSVADFDAAVRNNNPDYPFPGLPNSERWLAPAYNIGDWTHLNDAGYSALADSIDLGSLIP
jgi:lysophospholipase L1-like esterase